MSVETNLVTLINESVRKARPKPVKVIFHDLVLTGETITIDDVNLARRWTGGISSLLAPSTAIILEKRSGVKTNIGLRPQKVEGIDKRQALEVLMPTITRRFMNALHTKLMTMNLEEGDPVPLILGELNKREQVYVYIGRSATGGPVNYVYNGTGDGAYNEDNNVVNVSGSLVDPKEYSKTRTLYLKVTPLYPDQGWDSKTIKFGVPNVFGKSLKFKNDEYLFSITNTKEGAKEVIKL